MEDIVFDRFRRENEAKTGPFVCILVDSRIASISPSAAVVLGEDPSAVLAGCDVADYL